MNRPKNLTTKLFLDGGDPNESKQVIEMIGFLDGQTTNPTLISKNPDAQKRLAAGNKFTKEEIYDFYKSVVRELSTILPEGSISIEVYADKNTSVDEMFSMGKEMFSWIPNAHVKYPTTTRGLEAAEKSVREGMRVNLTLVFSQKQAAAVYGATKGTGEPSLPGFKNVFVSPFIGRLDDRDENGMDLIRNIIEMYKNSDHHVGVLTASVRNINHFLYAISLGSDIITAPFKVFQEWKEMGMIVPGRDFGFDKGALNEIPYEEIDLNKNWREHDIHHDLTDIGMEKFTADWNSLIDSV